MNESPKTRMQEIWQRQPVEGIKMSAEEIRSRAAKFEKKVFWRNFREHAAGAIAVIWLGIYFVGAHGVLDRSAFALLIAGMVYVMYQLHRQGGARRMPAAMEAGSSLEFYREELERQRNLVSSVWSWYLGPFVPGLVLSAVAAFVRNMQPHHAMVLGLWYALITGFFIFVWRLNVRAGRCLQRVIDELPAAEER